MALRPSRPSSRNPLLHAQGLALQRHQRRHRNRSRHHRDQVALCSLPQMNGFDPSTGKAILPVINSEATGALGRCRLRAFDATSDSPDTNCQRACPFSQCTVFPGLKPRPAGQQYRSRYQPGWAPAAPASCRPPCPGTTRPLDRPGLLAGPGSIAPPTTCTAGAAGSCKGIMNRGLCRAGTQQNKVPHRPECPARIAERANEGHRDLGHPVPSAREPAVLPARNGGRESCLCRRILEAGISFQEIVPQATEYGYCRSSPALLPAPPAGTARYWPWPLTLQESASPWRQRSCACCRATAMSSSPRLSQPPSAASGLGPSPKIPPCKWP
jgi:hypothetical protein